MVLNPDKVKVQIKSDIDCVRLGIVQRTLRQVYRQLVVLIHQLIRHALDIVAMSTMRPDAPAFQLAHNGPSPNSPFSLGRPYSPYGTLYQQATLTTFNKYALQFK